MDNSTRFKELQVVNGVLRRGDKGLEFLFLLGEQRRMDHSTPFQRSFFFKGLG